MVELLWSTVGGDLGIVVGPGKPVEESRGHYPGQQLIGSWNAPMGYGAELVQSVIKSGQSHLDSSTVCVPILCGGIASGAILISNSLTDSDHRPHLDSLPCIRSLAQLAGVALTTIGQKQELGRAENEFTDREALYATLIHESTAAIFVRDLGGRLLLANQAYARALGNLPLHSLLGQVVFEKLPPAQAEQHRDLDRAVFESGHELEALEQLGPNPSQLRTYLCLRIPSRDRWGLVTGICGICTDITELERTREQLERERHLSALGTFAGKIAHDFNNVLNGIVCNVEFLLGDLEIDSPWREGLSDIEFAAEQGVQLVKQILAFGGRQEPTRELVSLPDLLDSCVSLLKATLPAGTVVEKSVSPLLGPDGGMISGDPTQLNQVISNLLVNAAHSLPDGQGLIELNVEPFHQNSTRPISSLPPGDYLCLTIRDTGCGMSEQTLSRVFEPFFSTKPSGQGTGLGLAIVHGIVKSHDGHILVESQLGQGTKFSLFFPRGRAPGPINRNLVS